MQGKETLRQLPGNRDVRREEPPKEVSHDDFLLREVQDMAIDLHEEAY